MYIMQYIRSSLIIYMAFCNIVMLFLVLPWEAISQGFVACLDSTRKESRWARLLGPSHGGEGGPKGGKQDGCLSKVKEEKCYTVLTVGILTPSLYSQSFARAKSPLCPFHNVYFERVLCFNPILAGAEISTFVLPSCCTNVGFSHSILETTIVLNHIYVCYTLFIILLRVVVALHRHVCLSCSPLHVRLSVSINHCTGAETGFWKGGSG